MLEEKDLEQKRIEIDEKILQYRKEFNKLIDVLIEYRSYLFNQNNIQENITIELIDIDTLQDKKCVDCACMSSGEDYEEGIDGNWYKIDTDICGRNDEIINYDDSACVRFIPKDDEIDETYDKQIILLDMQIKALRDKYDGIIEQLKEERKEIFDSKKTKTYTKTRSNY